MYFIYLKNILLTYLLIEDNGAETIVLSVSLLTVVTGADVGGQDWISSISSGHPNASLVLPYLYKKTKNLV